MTKLSSKFMYLLKHIVNYTLTYPFIISICWWKMNAWKFVIILYTFFRVSQNLRKWGKYLTFILFAKVIFFLSFVHLNSFLIATVPDMIFSELWFFCDVKVIKKKDHRENCRIYGFLIYHILVHKQIIYM